METRIVPELNPFQRLVSIVERQVRLWGYTSKNASNEDIIRVACTHPLARQQVDANGWKWVWPDEEKARFCEVVRYNMAFREAPVYIFHDLVDIEVKVCAHGQRFYCADCRSAATRPPGKKRRKDGF